MDNSRAMTAIEAYMFDLFEPDRNWPEHEFRRRSYEIWAATEILNIVECHPYISPYRLVGDFACKTAKFSRMDHDNKSNNFIFSTAHDVATDILDILRAMD